MMKKVLFAAAAVGAGAITYREIVRPWWRYVGRGRRDVVRELPGDRARPWGTGPRYPIHRDRRSALRCLAVAAPDGLRAGWLVQLRHDRHGRAPARAGSSPSGRRSRSATSSRRIQAAVSWSATWSPSRALVLYSDTRHRDQPGEPRQARSDRSAPTANVQAATAPSSGRPSRPSSRRAGHSCSSRCGRPHAAHRAVPRQVRRDGQAMDGGDVAGRRVRRLPDDPAADAGDPRARRDARPRASDRATDRRRRVGDRC